MRSFEQEVVCEAPVAHVWRALTEPKQMALWLMNFDNDEGEMVADFRAEAGTSYRLQSTKARGWRGYVVGQVLEVVPARKLALTWAHSPGQDAHPVRITFTLEPRGQGTALRMVQAGYPGVKGWFSLQGAKMGWRKMLQESLPGVLRKMASSTPAGAAPARMAPVP